MNYQILDILLQPVITALSIFISIFIVVWQIKKQFKNNRELSKNNLKDELFLDIYKSIVPLFDITIQSINKSMSKVMDVPSTFSTQNILKDSIEEHQKSFKSFLNVPQDSVLYKSMELSPIKARAMDLNKLNYDAQENVFNLLRIIESYEIALIDFSSIKKGIIEQIQNFQEAYYKFFDRTVQFLPSDLPDDKIGELGKKVISPQLTDEKII